MDDASAAPVRPGFASLDGELSRRQLLELMGVVGAAALLSGAPGCAARSGPGPGARSVVGGRRAVVPFEFGCARHLYEKGIHPRLLLGPDDLEALREECRAGWCGQLLARLRQKVEPLVAGVLGGKDAASLVREPAGGAIVASLDDIALVALLDHNADALEAARRVLVSRPGAYGDGNLALGYDLMQPHLSDGDRRLFVDWAVDQMRRHLEAAGPRFLLGAGANHRWGPMFVALLLLLAIDGDPGVPPLGAERAELVRNFEAALYGSFGAEGYPAEDIGYGTQMVGWLTRGATCLRRAGLYDAYGRCPRFARAGNALLHFVQPWGHYLSNTGDHSDDFRCRELALAHLARYNGDPTLTWLLGTLLVPNLDPEYQERYAGSLAETELAPGFRVPTSAVSLIVLPDAPRPVHPRQARVPTAFMDSDRGIVSFRSGWGDDDTFVYFDGSQRPGSAMGHAHDSGGHFSLTALGEYFAVGPGRYGIEQDQHNVMLVDGKSGQSTDGNWGPALYQGRLIACRPGDFCDYAAADNSRQSNCYWSFRHLGLVKGPGAPGYVWTVDDVNGANDFREFWWTLHSEPGNRIELRGDHAVIIGRRHGNALHVHFALPDPAAYPRPHTLELAQDVPFTSSYKYVSRKEAEANAFHTVHHAVYFRPRLIGKLRGYNGSLLSVMVPRPAGAPEPKVEAIPTLMGALAMRLTFAGIQDTIIWASGHGLLEADGVKGRGRWVVVRRGGRGGRVLAHAIDQGDRLEVDGRSYPVGPAPAG